MTTIKGKDITLALDGVVVAASRSCTLKIDTDTQEVATDASGKWKDYIATRNGWSLSVDNLVSVYTLVNAKSLVGKTCAVRFNVTNAVATGNAIVTDITITGSVGEMATYSIQLQGTGELK